MEAFNQIISVLSGTLTIFAFLAFIIRPIREWILGAKKKREKEDAHNEARDEATRCSLRNLITDFYYRHRTNSEMHQYEFENVYKIYAAYKNLNGNSFVDKIWAEIQDWAIVE